MFLSIIGLFASSNKIKELWRSRGHVLQSQILAFDTRYARLVV